ncbi:hypothetical protein [Streptomyces sp. NPDC039028]|uniref:hypothetical protein n=1 Tax=unclassified Streptomyces TaxID=2593676 RepID=UPI0033E6CC81
MLTQEFEARFDDVSGAAGCTFVSAELNREHCDGPSDLETRPDKELIAVLVAAGEGTDGQDEAESA